MNNRLIIIGAGGHGKVIADIAKLNGYKDIVYLDDDRNIQECAGCPVIGTVPESVFIDGDKIVAIGDSETREEIQKKINTITLIHPNAVQGSGVEIGCGTVVMAGVVINSSTKIGVGCVINTSSSIDHDCVIEDYVHVAVGAHICGNVHIGKGCWIGAGAVVSNNISICDDVIIGAGAIVVNDIVKRGTYVGVPAKVLVNKE